jgi:hypothetical protein
MNENAERDGQEVPYTIRDVTTSDVASYRRILLDTSSRDRYYRFFHHVKHFDDVHLRRQLEPCTDAVGVIAQDGVDPLGIAHAFVQPDGSAEFAVVIAANARRRGVAASLFGTIVMLLRSRGISRLMAISLADNGPFARFAKACGMESEPPDDEGIVAWALDLTTDRAVAMWSQVASARSMAAG